MEPELRAITPDEFEEFTSVIGHAFGWDFRDEELELWRNSLEFDRTLCAFDGGRIVSTAGADSFEMAIPGGTIRCESVKRA